jgi:signal transduction histidine kinase/DNA-binding NarL/FixJ family response regulator/streptogramin lyase
VILFPSFCTRLTRLRRSNQKSLAQRETVPSRFAWLALLAIVLLPATARAESDDHNPRWVQHHYGSIDGLPVGSASSARVDRDGFLWIATHDGLARFDGQQFDVHESMRYPAMSGNRVLTLHNDRHGQLFAHSEHGDWLSVQSGKIDRVDLANSTDEYVRFVDPQSLCVTTATALHCSDDSGEYARAFAFPAHTDPALALLGASDDVWMMTRGSEVWRYQSGAWRVLRRPQGQASRLAPQTAALGKDGSIWLESMGRLVSISYDDSVREWHGRDDPKQVRQIRRDIDDSLWISAANGIFRIASGEIERIYPRIPPADDSIYGSWRAPDGALWISDRNQLFRFSSIPQIDNAPADRVLSASGMIRELLFDATGVVWVMTLRDGVYRLSTARVELLGKEVGMAFGNVYGISKDAQGTVWLGSLGSGLAAVARDGSIRRYGRAQGLPGDNPWLVAAAPDGSVLAGTYAPGLWQLAPHSDRFSAVPLPPELQREQILTIAFDASNRFLLGTTDGAWRQDGGQWSRIWPTDQRRTRINAMALDGETLWLGGAEGVWRLSVGKEYPVAEQLLARTSVRDVYIAHDNALWISTNGRGLVRVAADDPHGYQPVQLGRAQGLPSNSPHTVREDAQNNVWINSNQGIFRISQQNLKAFLAGRVHTLSPLVLGLADGMTELEGNGGVQPAATFDDDGRLWFPSQRGVVRFDPIQMPLRENAPQATIDALESEGKPLIVDADNELPIGVRSVQIRYGAADLSAGGQVRFRYRLLPQDQGWTEAQSARTASYAALLPGTYRFELIAGNSDGVWADQPATLVFSVPFHWYETRLAYWMALSLAVIGTFLLFRLRLRQLRQRAVELDMQVRQRTLELSEEKNRVEETLTELAATHTELARTHAEIESRNLRLAAQAQRLESLDRFRSRLLADVSHELRTPLMLVSLPLRDLQQHATRLDATERSRLELSLKQLDRLGGLVEQLVGLVQAESGQMPLRMQRLDLIANLRDIIAGYTPMAELVQVEIALSSNVEQLWTFADRAHLATIFGNLIDNAIKYSPAQSTISIHVDWNDESAQVCVKDQGPGFDSSVAEHLFERFYRAEGPPRLGREGLGIGLALARELVELHAGKIAASSEPGSGARFCVELPLGTAHIAIDDLTLTETHTTTPITATHPAQGEGRVILIEDHPELAAYLAERLGELVPVRCVGSAEEALQVLETTHDVRLVISDVILPGLSGIDLCRRITATTNQETPPVILISAKAGTTDREAGISAGAFAYLAKPFGLDALLQEMARAWPAASARLQATSVQASDIDPLLVVGLKHLSDPSFGVGEWSNLAYLSERQLRRRVNELTGLSPQIWLREQRLLRVRQLLRSGECKTLAEAGSRSGLENPAYLYRTYRARFGDQ